MRGKASKHRRIPDYTAPNPSRPAAFPKKRGCIAKFGLKFVRNPARPKEPLWQGEIHRVTCTGTRTWETFLRERNCCMGESRNEIDRKREELEKTLRTRLSEGDRDGVATLVIESYGPEVYSFLVAVHRNDADADDELKRQ